MWRKYNLFALLVGGQIGAATVESSMELLYKISFLSGGDLNVLSKYLNVS